MCAVRNVPHMVLYTGLIPEGPDGNAASKINLTRIAVDMAAAVTKLDRRNQELMKEIDRLTEEVQLLELKIKK